MINKTIFLLLLMMLLSSFRKEVGAQIFRGGLQAGLTASEVSGDDAGGADKLGWFASVFINQDIRPNTRIQFEMMYIQKGSRVYHDPWDDEHGTLPGDGFVFARNALHNDPIDPPGDGYRDYKFYLHYVEIPVMLQFDFSPLTRLPYVEYMSGELGLSASTVVAHREEKRGVSVADEMAERRPFKLVEMNLLAGLHFPITDGLTFNWRLSQGVTPVRTRFSEDEVVCANTLECYRKRHQFNTVWSFGLTYTFLTRN